MIIALDTIINIKRTVVDNKQILMISLIFHFILVS